MLPTPAGSPTVRFAGRHLYSRHDPASAVASRVGRVAVQAETLYLAFSPLLGYGLEELLSALPASSHVLALECHSDLVELSHSSPSRLDAIVAAYPQACTVVDAASPLSAARALQEIGVGRFRRVLPLVLSGGHQLARSEYDEISRVIDNEVRTHWQNRITLMAMGRLWARNLIDNLALLPGGTDAGTLRTDAPVVVCGAGPTLVNHLSWLHQHRERMLLIAVDTALATLSAAGLRPDCVFVLEAQHANVSDFVANVDRSLPIVADLTSSPAVLRLFEAARAPRHFYASRYSPVSILQRLEEEQLLPRPTRPLGSVGVAAVAVALEMTAAPVLMAGLDFSYPRGATHARGAPSHLAVLSAAHRLAPPTTTVADALLRRPLIKVPSKGGSEILTDLVLDSYATQLRRISSAIHRAYDLSGPGLPIAERTLEHAEAADLLASAATAAAPSLRPGPPYPADAVRSFVQAEIRLIASCLRWLDADVDTVVQPLHLRPLDYLCIDLPDAPQQLRSPTAAFVRQVRQRGQEALSRLERTRRRLVAG